jgi:hypothetical protein
MDNSIFISQHDSNTNSDISGKITYTSIFNSIPENKVNKQIENWKNKYKTEWRWRFLKIKLPENKERFVAEISYTLYNSDKRLYINKYGNWIERHVDPIYDKYVVEEYYVYSNA